MKFLNLILALTLMVTLTACQKTTDTMTQADHPPSSMMEAVPKMWSVETSQPADENMEAFSASYTAYQADEALGQKHILFFHAPWCPTCAKWEAMLEENMGELRDNVVIYKTDYDTSDDLKAQYEITQQSTAVFVNADGSAAKQEADPSIESMNAFFAN